MCLNSSNSFMHQSDCLKPKKGPKNHALRPVLAIKIRLNLWEKTTSVGPTPRSKTKMKSRYYLAMQLIMVMFFANLSFAKDNTLFAKKPVLVMSANAGDAPGEFGSTGQGDGLGPMDFALDINNDIWIMDTVNRRVQRFDQNGNFILEFPNKKNPSPIELTAQNLESDSAGNIFIGPLKKGEIIKINTGGEYLGAIKLPDVEYESIDFAANSHGELIYYRTNETIVINTDTGGVIKRIKDGPIIKGGNSSPFSGSVLAFFPKEEKIVDSAFIEKGIRDVPKLNGDNPSHILFVDPFDNLFVKTIIYRRDAPLIEYISYRSKDGTLIAELPRTTTQSGREKLGGIIYNIDKDGNLYGMEISLDRDLEQDESINIHIRTYEPFLYIWKWERR